MSLRRLAVGAVALGVVSSLAVVAPASSAVAQGPGPVVITIRGATDVVADPVTQRVFVSTGTENLVKVFTWDGAVVGELAVGRPLGMDFDPTSGQVFVAAGATGGIVAIDTATLATSGYSAGGAGCPTSVAVMGDVVWFSYEPVGCDGAGGIGYLDLAEQTPSGVLTDLDSVSDPLVGGAAGVLTSFGQGAETWLVSGDQQQKVASAWLHGNDIAAAPDATEVVLSDGNSQSYDPLTFEPQTLYPPLSGAVSADFSPDGSLAAIGANSVGTGVSVYPRGSDTPVAEWDLWDAVLGGRLASSGLAMGGTSRVFALAEHVDRLDSYLVIYKLGTDAPSALALDPLRFGEIEHEVTISGRLLGAPALVDQVVEIRRIDPPGSPSGGATVPLGTASVNADGTFSFADTPTDVGFTRYVARWGGSPGGSGNSSGDPSEAAVAIDVRRHPTTLTLDLGGEQFGANELITATMLHSDTDPDPGVITLYREDAWGFRYEVASGAVAAGEPLVVQVEPDSNGRLIAEYSGSATGDEARVVSGPYTVIPVVSGVVKPAYKVRGDTWFVAPGDTPRVRWKVKPTPFSFCSSLTLQHATPGGWKQLRHSDCVYLLSNGPTTPLKRDHADGDRWRVRVVVGEYATHTAGASPWVYITFRKPLQ